MNVYNVAICLFIYISYRNSLVQSVNDSLKNAFFPENLNINSLAEQISKVLNNTNLQQNTKNEQMESKSDNLKLITLDVRDKRSTDHIDYEYNPSERSYTYTSREPYLINKVKMGDELLWQSKNKQYGDKVVVTKDENREALLTVNFPITPKSHNIVGVDLLLVDDKQSYGQIRSKRRSSESVDSLRDLNLGSSKKVLKKEPTVQHPQASEPKSSESPKSQPELNVLPRKKSISESEPPSQESKPPQKDKLATLDLEVPSSTEEIDYEYNSKDGTQTFTPKLGYKISTIKRGEDFVWESKNDVYPEKVLLLPVSDGEPIMRMVFTKPQSGPDSKLTVEPSEPVVSQKNETESKQTHDFDNKSIKYMETKSDNEDVSTPAKPVPPKLSVKTPESKPEVETKKVETIPDIPEEPVKHEFEAREQTHESMTKETKVSEPAPKEPEPNPVEMGKSVPTEPPKPTQKSLEPEKVESHEPQPETPKELDKFDLNAKKQAGLDINSTSSTDFYDYYVDGESVIYEVKNDYVFISVQDTKILKTIWKADKEDEYATKVVRNNADLRSVTNKISIFFMNGQIKHYVNPSSFWKEASIDVILDISNAFSTYEYSYTQFQESDFFEAKYNFRFKTIKEANTQIWESKDDEHSNVVVSTGTKSKNKVLTINFVGPRILKFTKSGKDPWIQDTSFSPVPKSLDIKTPNKVDHDIFTHFAKQGNVFNLIKRGSEIIWKSRSSEENAKKVVVYAINKNYLYITIHSLKGGVTKFFKYPNDECREIDSSTKIPITINVESTRSSCAYYNYSRGNVRMFRAKDDYVFGGVREKNESSSDASYDRIIWRADPNVKDTNKYSNKVEFIKYNQFKEMYEVTVYCMDGTTRKYIKHENVQWTFVDPNNKLPVPINLNSQFECYKYTISYKNGVKSFSAKLGIVFNSVKSNDDEVTIWEAKNPNEYANEVELDTMRGVKKAIIHLQKGGKKVFIKKSDKKWVEDVESRIEVSETPAKEDASTAVALTKTDIQQKYKPEYSNDVKLYSKDPKDYTKTNEMSSSQYEIKQIENKYEFKLKEGSKCVEVKYMIKIKDFLDPNKTIGLKPVTVWKRFFTKTDENYPKSVIYQWPNKIVVNFDTFFIVNEKETSGTWVSRNFDIKFYSESTGSGGANNVEMDYTKYELRKMAGERYDYEFKPSAKCAEIKNLFKNQDPHDKNRAVVRYVTVWKHGQHGYEEYPTSVSYMSENRLIVDLGTRMITCEKDSDDNWTPKESYLTLYTNPLDPNGSVEESVPLDEKHYRLQKSPDELSYTLNDGVKCTKISYVEKIGDPSDIAKVTVHNKKVWIYNQRIYRGKYPKNILYQYGKKIIMKFDEMVLIYEVDGGGNWVQAHLFDTSEKSHTPSNDATPKVETGSSNKSTTPIKSANEPIKETVALIPTENIRSATPASENRTLSQNVKEVDPSDLPKEVNIITQGSSKSNDASKFKVFTNPDNDFFLYKFIEGSKCTEIRHTTESAENGTTKADDKSDKMPGKEKVVWSYGSKRYGLSYPEAVFYNKKSSSFIIIFSDHNLICIKKNGSWVVSSSTGTC